MLRRFLVVVVLLVPVYTQADNTVQLSEYVIGKWNVEGVKKDNSNVFQPPKHSMHWEFTRDGKLIEELGKSGAKVEWRYRIVGHNIKVQLGSMAFTWSVLGTEPNIMLVKHQIGTLKVIRIK